MLLDHLIRLAEPEDLTTVRAVVEDAYAAYIPRIGQRPGPMDSDYSSLIADQSVYILLIDTTPAGVLVVFETAEGWLLDNVAVARECRGRGVGKFLISYAEEHARSRGADRIRLYTHVLMTENRELYPRLGYRETHRITEAGFERVYFEKPLRHVQ